MGRTALLTGMAAIITLMALVAYVALGDGGSRGGSADGVSSAGFDCGAMWQQGFELNGVVGGRPSQAYFDRAAVQGAPEQVSGIVRFPEERTGGVLADTLIGLAGPLTDDHCVAQLKERDGEVDGRVWRLRIESPVRLSGTRQMPDGRAESIDLSIVPETPCDVVSEWRRFSSPRWPITFDYPAGWALSEDEDDITIECASITALATTRPSLIFERGRFPPRGARPSAGPAASFHDPYWFLQFPGDDWRVGPHGCVHPERASEGARVCPPARRSQRDGMTVLQGAAGEHRLYRPGVGYLGPGRGITRFLFIVGEDWVSLDSAGESSHYDDIGAEGGPVLFDGDRVGDRVVRSITAR